MPTARIEQDDGDFAAAESDRAFWAARRLHMVSTVIIILSTAGMAILCAVGTVLIVKGDTDADRNVGIALIAGGVASELQALLVSIATQAVASDGRIDQVSADTKSSPVTVS